MFVSNLRKAKWDFFQKLHSLIRSPKQFRSLYHSLSPNRQRLPHTLTDGVVTAESATSKANLLASHSTACYSQPVHTSDCICDTLSPNTADLDSGLSLVSCSAEETAKLLGSLKVKTASGPDGLSCHMLKNTSHTISTSLTDLFNLSLSSGIVPTDWKLSNIIPVFKGKGTLTTSRTTDPSPYCLFLLRSLSE